MCDNAYVILEGKLVFFDNPKIKGFVRKTMTNFQYDGRVSDLGSFRENKDSFFKQDKLKE
jgi:hypothetical protein